MSQIGLEFLPNPGGEAEGLSDAGIETFRDKPFAAVARETGQNSRDARLDPNKPVKLTFDVLTVVTDEFPSIHEFRAAVNRCLQKAQTTNNEKDLGFFTQAVKALSAPELKILKISDFNTKGVRGPCEEGNPFHTLAKTDGVSTKEDINAGGSFGIGKSAVFALSDIQTAFFSTRYKGDGGTEEILCMGKALFISHKDDKGVERRRKGYWGKKDGYMPLENETDIPKWLQRDVLGTSIFSICMRDNATDWRYEMAAAILINFFCAIQRNEMEFEIDDGTLKINKVTIGSYFLDPLVNRAVDELNVRNGFETAHTLYNCLTDDKSITKVLEVKELGKVNLRILIRDDLGYSVGIIRNGMYITDNLTNFNEPFKRFPLHCEFAAIVEPGGVIEGEWFKRLENPRHDNLSAERITDPELRDRGRRAFTSLAKQIRQTLRELAKSEPATSIQLDELNDYFASEAAWTEDDDGFETNPKALKPTPIQPSEPRKNKKFPHPQGEVDVGPGPLPTPSPSPDPSPQPNPLPGPNDRPKKVGRPIFLENERNVIVEPSKPEMRRLIFTVPTKGVLNLTAVAPGLNSSEKLSIVSSSTGEVKTGLLILTVEKGQRIHADVEFQVAYKGPIELIAIMENDEEGIAA